MRLKFNQVLISGNATADPTTRQAGKDKVSSFRLASNRSFKRGDDWAEETTYIECEGWGPLAERIAKSVTKGTEVFIRGRLKNDEWTDKESGQKRSKHKISIMEIHVGKAKDGAGVASESSEGDASEGMGELPF